MYDHLIRDNLPEIASPLPAAFSPAFFRWSMQVERKLEDLGAVKSYRTIYGRQQIGIRPVVSSWGTINGWLRTINTIHKQFRPFDRINTRVNVAGKALHGLVHAFFFDSLFGWRVWLWVELKKGVSFLECIISWIWLEMRFDSFSGESDSFDQINQSCRTYFVFSLHIHFIQAPSGVFVKSLLRLPDIMDCVYHNTPSEFTSRYILISNG